MREQVQIVESYLTSFSSFHVYRWWGEGVWGGGGGSLGVGRNVFKTYLRLVYPAAMIPVMCRIPYSENRSADMQKGAGFGGHTFTYGIGHL